ncbi:MAG: class I SAM-dependent methyltransferase [Pirellulaceae bacterium]|nr:class I SAM-dependent methyltransferase [Pirellulaceae bacterium]
MTAGSPKGTKYAQIPQFHVVIEVNSPILVSDKHFNGDEVDQRNFFTVAGHLHTYRDRTQAFLQQLHYELAQCGTGSTALDVGCGHGIALDNKPQYQIAKKVGTYWGVEPDTGVTSPDCFHRVWSSTLEDADIPESSVDVAYSQMVLEHVMDPEPFLEKISKILKPGGVFLSLTVNAHSTFARIASTCHRLGIQDMVLRVARGKQLVEDYHYPAVYKMTSQAYLETVAPRYGLEEINVAYLEADEWLVYFPKGTRWFGNLLTKTLQRRVKNYSWLMVKLRKKSLG